MPAVCLPWTSTFAVFYYLQPNASHRLQGRRASEKRAQNQPWGTVGINTVAEGEEAVNSTIIVICNAGDHILHLTFHRLNTAAVRDKRIFSPALKFLGFSLCLEPRI